MEAHVFSVIAGAGSGSPVAPRICAPTRTPLSLDRTLVSVVSRQDIADSRQTRLRFQLSAAVVLAHQDRLRCAGDDWRGRKSDEDGAAVVFGSQLGRHGG